MTITLVFAISVAEHPIGLDVGYALKNTLMSIVTTIFVKENKGEKMSKKRTTIVSKPSVYCHWCDDEVSGCDACDGVLDEGDDIFCVDEGKRHIHIGCDDT